MFRTAPNLHSVWSLYNGADDTSTEGLIHQKFLVAVRHGVVHGVFVERLVAVLYTSRGVHR